VLFPIHRLPKGRTLLRPLQSPARDRADAFEQSIQLEKGHTKLACTGMDTLPTPGSRRVAVMVSAAMRHPHIAIANHDGGGRQRVNVGGARPAMAHESSPKEAATAERIPVNEVTLRLIAKLQRDERQGPPEGGGAVPGEQSAGSQAVTSRKQEADGNAKIHNLARQLHPRWCKFRPCLTAK
jgi:hypothetical protein